jgi:hypothetical protein
MTMVNIDELMNNNDCNQCLLLHVLVSKNVNFLNVFR